MSNWKTEGGNRINSIVNANTDITNKYFSTDPTLSVNDREGIYYNKENGATVLGVGTKFPYSRFSFGDYKLNNFENNVIKSESLVNTPTIALSEKSDGTNGTGISFFYNKAGSGESRGIRFIVNNNETGTIFNSSLEPQAMSDENTLMLLTNDGNTNNVLVNTTTSNFPNPKKGFEVNGEIRATEGIILKGLNSNEIDKQAGLIFYDIVDKKIKWCTGSGDDIRTVVASGDSAFVIDTSTYDASFALVTNPSDNRAVLAFKDIGFAIGNGEMIANRFIGETITSQTLPYLKRNIPAFSIIGQTVGSDDYNANMMITQIDHMDGTPILSGTSHTDLSMNGVLYLLNNLAIDVFKPKSIIDVSKNNVPFLNIGIRNENYTNSVTIGTDISGSNKSFYFGETLSNQGNVDNSYNFVFGKDNTINGYNNTNNFIFGDSLNINDNSNNNNIVFGTALNVDSDVSYCLIMGNGGEAKNGDLIKYHQLGITDPLFHLKSGGHLYIHGNVGIGKKDPTHKLEISDGTRTGVIHTDSGQNSLNIGTISNTDLNIITNNTTKATLTTSGRFGIGTTNPASLLHIRDITTPQTPGTIALRAEGSIATFAYDNDNDIRAKISNDISGGELRLYNDNSEEKILFSAIDTSKNFINNGGNLGIGTNDPQAKLHIVHANDVAFGTKTIVAEGSLALNKLNNNTPETVYLTSGDDVNAGGALHLSNKDGVKKIQIDASGNTYFNGEFANFGIGTNNPSQKLDVNGNIMVGGAENTIYFNDTTNSIGSSGTDIIFKTNSAERLCIKQDGKIGIGKSNPVYDMDIQGTLSIDGLVISGNPFDAVATSSWNSTFSNHPGITTVNYKVGVNQNIVGNNKNFKPRFDLDVSGNTKSNNYFLGEFNFKIIPLNFTDYQYQIANNNEILVGTTEITEADTSNTNPAWHLFDNNNNTIHTLDHQNITSVEYLKDNGAGTAIKETINGVYFEITTPKLWSIKNYSFYFNEDISQNKTTPKKWYLLGKTHLESDNTILQSTNDWKIIDEQDIIANWSEDNTNFYQQFSVGEYMYSEELFKVFRFVITETYEKTVGNNPSNFVVELSQLQMYGETPYMHIKNKNMIQSSYSELNTNNKHLLLQPYGNYVGINNKNPQVIFDINDPSGGAIRIPVGTTSQGNTVATTVGASKGYLRYNTDKNQFEGYDGSSWKGLGGVVDADQDTYVDAEKTSDDDTLRFYTKGIEAMHIDGHGNFDISANIMDISCNKFMLNNSVIVDVSNVSISNNLTVSNDLSSNKIISKNIHLADRILRSGDVIKSTHPEDPISYLFDLQGLNGVFDVTFSSILNEYHINNAPFPQINVFPGSVIQFNLNLTDNSFNIFKGFTANTNGEHVSGLVHVSETGEISSGTSANNKLTGTLYWHVPLNGTGNYRYQSKANNTYKGDIVVKHLPTDISNNKTLTQYLHAIDLSANKADIVEISNNILNSKTIHSTDISASTFIVGHKMAISHANPTVSLDISANDAIRIPVGTDAQRGSITAGYPGYIRYSTTSNQFEGYDGANWTGLGGVVSLDQQTKITAHDDSADGLKFITDGNEQMRILGDGKIGIKTQTPNVILEINDTGAIRIPVGTTGQGETIASNFGGSKGYLRFNTDKNQFEGYDGSSWKGLGGVVDIDQDTLIDTSGNDNILRFFTAGAENMTINTEGNIDISGNLDISKNLTVKENIFSHKVESNYIKLDSKLLRNGTVIKNTHPEDPNSYLFELQSHEAIFDVSFNTILNEYHLNGTPQPQINAYPGSILQFNLDTGSENFKIFKGSQALSVGTDVSGIVHVADDKIIDSGIVNNVNTGTLFWHVPFDAIGHYRYQSQNTDSIKGDIVIKPHISDISNNNIVCNQLVINNDLSGNNARLYDVSVNRLWIGPIEMIGHVPGNISNPNGFGEFIGDFKITGNLDVSGDILVEGAENTIYFKDTTNSISSSGTNLILKTDSKNRLHIDPSGNIGIGAETPSQKLDVSGNILVRGEENTIYFKNTTNSISSSGTNLILKTDSKNRLHIDSIGNIGIGAETPSQKLDVSGNILVGGEENTIYFKNTTNSISSSGTNLILKTDSKNRLHIDSIGNIGIGTSDPSSNLHVQNSNNNGDTEIICTGGTGGGGDAKIYLGQTLNHGGGIKYNASNNIIHIFRRDNGTNSNVISIPYYLSNVGIGTDTPQQKLHVNGNILFGDGRANGFQQSGSWAIGLSAVNGGIASDDNIGSGTNGFTGMRIVSHRSDGNDYTGGIQNYSQNIEFYTHHNYGGAYKTRMTIAYNGNIGIGTTTPATTTEIALGNINNDGTKKLYITYTGTGAVSTASNSGLSGTTGFQLNAPFRLRKDDYSTYGISLKMGHFSDTGVCYIQNEDPNTGARNICLQPYSGNVGIGKTPEKVDNAKLEVGGDVTIGWILDSKDGIWISHSQSSGVYSTTPFIQGVTSGFSPGNIALNPSSGNVGIGTNNPREKLHVQNGHLLLYANLTSGTDAQMSTNAQNAQIYLDCNNHTGTANGIVWKTRYANNAIYTKTSAKIVFQPEGNYFRGGIGFYTNGTQDNTTSSQERMRINQNGNVGIGSSPISTGYPLTVTKGSYVTIGYARFLHKDGANLGSPVNYGAYDVSIYASYGIRTEQHFWATSDLRIKTNISDVPDDLSLEQIRNIPVRYYEYIDKVNRNSGKQIGFMAQEVKEFLPSAINITTGIIPNEMRIVENTQWTTVYPIDENGNIDPSANVTYKLTISDLSDNSGNTLYRFYVSNDLSGNDEFKKEIKSLDTDPKSFIFEQKWNNVFIYGKEVDDFHTIDKNKIFAINFSATQEIDRIQQAEKTKLETTTQELNEAKVKITQLEQKNTQLEQTLQQILNRLSALENA